MSKILVTGANGFVGKNLCRALKQLNHDVIELTSSAGDIIDTKTWETIPPTDTVIHLAAKTFVPDSWKNPDLFLQTNTLGTVMALEYCRKYNARMVFISSYLYGNPESLPIHETAKIVTPNPYALSKKGAEDYCKFYADSFNVNMVIIRPFNLYGYGQSDNFLIPEIILQVLKGKEVHVKDLEPKRDYIYIADFIDAIIRSIDMHQFELFNIGSGISYSVGEIIQMIQDICGTAIPVISSAEKRPAEIMDTVADISKAKELLNWTPTTSIYDGLSAIVQLYKQAQQA
ncbi:MAG: NAD(P)-dependent oxidoreductase [Bacteroidota bacterium]